MIALARAFILIICITGAGIFRKHGFSVSIIQTRGRFPHGTDDEARCSVQAFKASSEDDNASRRLLGAIERYFQQGAVGSVDDKVRSTLLPPIYLQRPSKLSSPLKLKPLGISTNRGPQEHSLTIVGLEKHKGGDVHLLVFDPEFQSSSTVVRLAGKATLRRQSKVTKLLEPYRRSATHLERFNEFEVL